MDALSQSPHKEVGQFFQCMEQTSLTWSDIWTHILESYAHDPKVEQICKSCSFNDNYILSTPGMGLCFEGKAKSL